MVSRKYLFLQTYIITLHMYMLICTYISIHCSAVSFEFLILGSILNITLQPSGLDQNIVGQRQDVICSISVPPDVDPDIIELGWVNEDDIITNDSRVTIDTSSYYFNNSTVVTTIQFDPLTEEDEDEYICYAFINGSFVFESISLQNITCK